MGSRGLKKQKAPPGVMIKTLWEEHDSQTMWRLFVYCSPLIAN